MARRHTLSSSSRLNPAQQSRWTMTLSCLPAPLLILLVATEPPEETATKMELLGGTIAPAGRLPARTTSPPPVSTPPALVRTPPAALGSTGTCRLVSCGNRQSTLRQGLCTIGRLTTPSGRRHGRCFGYPLALRPVREGTPVPADWGPSPRRGPTWLAVQERLRSAQSAALRQQLQPSGRTVLKVARGRADGSAATTLTPRRRAPLRVHAEEAQQAAATLAQLARRSLLSHRWGSQTPPQMRNL